MRLPYRFLSSMVLVNLISAPAVAKRFENSYISFDVPDNWTCGKEDDDYVCSPPLDANGKKNMIAILTAKFAGPGDSPQLYKDHLQQLGTKQGVKVDVAPDDTLIGQFMWIDATLENTEIKNYSTRYLARTEGDIGVLVTFSAHRSVSTQAQPISDMIAKSVQVNSYFAHPELRNQKQ